MTRSELREVDRLTVCLIDLSKKANIHVILYPSALIYVISSLKIYLKTSNLENPNLAEIYVAKGRGVEFNYL